MSARQIKKICITLVLVFLLPLATSCRRATLKAPRFGQKDKSWDNRYAADRQDVSRPGDVLSITDLQMQRKVEDYFGPLPDVGQIKKVYHKPVRAIYISSAENLEANLDLIRETEINAVVLDFKETWGFTYDSKLPIVDELGLNRGPLDMPTIVQELKDAGAYVIARITCFKDSDLSEKKPEWTIKDRDGQVLHWNMESNLAFMSPYNKEVWNYLVDAAIEAVELGADEIQFDYVRFPSGSANEGTDPYYGPESRVPHKIYAINRFLEYARVRLSDNMGIPISADVFPAMILNEIDADILGQQWATMGITGITSLCPMIYPSHFASKGDNGEGSYIHGELFEAPDKEPYGVVKQTLLAARARVEETLPIEQQQSFAYVRPYLQAFDAGWLGAYSRNYDPETIREQMQACYDLGVNEWILWNVWGEYDPEIFHTEW